MPPRFLLISRGEGSTWSRTLAQAVTSLGGLELVTEKLPFERATQTPYDIIFVDASAVPDTVFLISRLRQQCPQARVVVVTASPTWQQARDAFHSGATDYIRKTLNRKEILAVMKDILSQPQPNSNI